MNMAFAINTLDFKWLREVAFNATTNSLYEMSHNYALFKVGNINSIKVAS